MPNEKKKKLCRCGHPPHTAQCPANDGCWCDSFAKPCGAYREYGMGCVLPEGHTGIHWGSGDPVGNSDPSRDVETFYVTAGTFENVETVRLPGHFPGWYWQPAEPGTGRGPFGPFATEADALADARFAGKE